MANLLRKAKSTSSWSNYDLEAFNISIVHTGLTSFFGVEELPHSPFANNVVLNSEYEPQNRDGLSKDEADFFFYQTAAEGGGHPVESAVGDLAAFLLHLFHFSSRDRFICQRPRVQIEMLGKSFNAMVNVALVDRHYDFLLLVQDLEDKMVGNFLLQVLLC